MFRVLIAGVRREQIKHLRSRLPIEISVRAIELTRLLKIRTMQADLVLCTRFLSHKHTTHLRTALQTRFVFATGGVGSWAYLIREECALSGLAGVSSIVSRFTPTGS